MDELINTVRGTRGRPLQRTYEERRGPKRSRSRKRGHFDHFHQKLYGGQAKFLKTTAMITLMLGSPLFIIYSYYTLVQTDGSIDKSWKFFLTRGIIGFKDVWPFPTIRALRLIFYFAVFEAALQVLVPGERYLGPSTPAGNRPLYTKNGVPCFLTTIVVYYLLYKEKWFNPAQVYDLIGEIQSVLICSSYVLSVLLYFKGHISPSTSDWGTSGNVLVDYFWGMELYPRMWKVFDIKIFLNCRFAIMGWAVLVLSFAIKQFETQGQISDSLMVTSLLMLIYITKFFWTEAAFWSSLEIAHDRGPGCSRPLTSGLWMGLSWAAVGWFFVWNSLTWIPSVYPAVNLYLVSHPVKLGRGVAMMMFLFGASMIYICWDCDRQRQVFRHSHGKCRIWGKVPTKILAQYQTKWGEHKQSLLLTAGWWGIARHFHYAPEIGVAFFWTIPALFRHAIPYFYITFLTVLLMDRANRDDKNCRIKYHKYYEAYCKRVRFKIVPQIF